MDPSPIRAANFCPRGLRVTTFGKKLQKTKDQTYNRSSKVFLRQKKSLRDFFGCRPCGRSAQTTVRHQRFVYAKKNREAIFFGVDRAAVRRRPPVDVRLGWQAQRTPSWLAQQTPSWLAQKIGPTRPANFCLGGLKVWARLKQKKKNSHS